MTGCRCSRQWCENLGARNGIISSGLYSRGATLGSQVKKEEEEEGDEFNLIKSNGANITETERL